MVSHGSFGSEGTSNCADPMNARSRMVSQEMSRQNGSYIPRCIVPQCSQVLMGTADRRSVAFRTHLCLNRQRITCSPYTPRFFANSTGSLSMGGMSMNSYPRRIACPSRRNPRRALGPRAASLPSALWNHWGVLARVVTASFKSSLNPDTDHPGQKNRRDSTPPAGRFPRPVCCHSCEFPFVLKCCAQIFRRVVNVL